MLAGIVTLQLLAIVQPHAHIVDLVFFHTMVKLDLCGPWPMVLFKFAPTVNCLDFDGF